MKIFIIGASQTFKTEFAKELASRQSTVVRISASEWIRERHPDLLHSQEDAVKLTQLSISALKEDPDVCVNYIHYKILNKQYNMFGRRNIFCIEGVRNPNDFQKLFNPKEDYVVLLRTPTTVYYSDFERQGVETIQSLVEFNALLGFDKYKKITLFSHEDVAKAVSFYIKENMVFVTDPVKVKIG